MEVILTGPQKRLKSLGTSLLSLDKIKKAKEAGMEEYYTNILDAHKNGDVARAAELHNAYKSKNNATVTARIQAQQAHLNAEFERTLDLIV